MSARQRRRVKRRAACDPFAWFATNVLLAAALKLTDHGLAVWLALNANWDYRTIKGIKGRAHLSDRQAKAMLRLGKAALDKGRREVLDSGLAVEREAATRPGGPGGALGRSATYDLPHRHGGMQPRLVLPVGIRRPEGHIRYNVKRLRADLLLVRGEALRVFIYALAKHDRTRHGELADAKPFELSAAEIAKNLELPLSSAAAAIVAAIRAGMLEVVREAAGRAPRQVRLPLHHWHHERRHTPKSKLPMAPTRDPGSGGYGGMDRPNDLVVGGYGI